MEELKNYYTFGTHRIRWSKFSKKIRKGKNCQKNILWKNIYGSEQMVVVGAYYDFSPQKKSWSTIQ